MNYVYVREVEKKYKQNLDGCTVHDRGGGQNMMFKSAIGDVISFSS